MECGISENRGDSKSNETDGGGEVKENADGSYTLFWYKYIDGLFMYSFHEDFHQVFIMMGVTEEMIPIIVKELKPKLTLNCEG